ncbi:hypothetical protein ILUMI_10986 [Ignelater luminosus]|uniref:Uncharacterized protein n=1 Tax=Ignelater luminosus TaxID=2038154 RepID=A0A8K0GDN0_IGNLU|nr:hypothetical protein ILUMI_10986 [Ignelater luminosus]
MALNQTVFLFIMCNVNMNQATKMVPYYIIAFSLLMYVVAAPRQNKTQVPNAPRHNNTVSHALANSNRTGTSVTQHIQNSKKTNIPSTDEIINTIIGFALNAFGTLTELHEMAQDLPIIGKK